MSSTTFHTHRHELAARLQKEIDHILHGIDDTKMYAEFKEVDIIDIQDGIHHETIRESIDERIQFNIARRAKKQPLIAQTVHQSVHHSKKIHKGIRKFLDYLLKPFEF